RGVWGPPPRLAAATGARGSALTHAERWALPFMRAGRQTIVFGRARVAVEIILSRLRGGRRGHLARERPRGAAPADGAAGDRARPARRRDPRRRLDERPGAGRRHRGAGRVD